MNWLYRILETNTGNFYIGSSKNIKKRISEHFNDLKCNKHHCYPLQALYNHFGKEAFIVQKLYNFEFLSDAREAEDLIIKSFLSLNLSMSSTSAVTFMDESRRKFLSNMNKGNTYNLGRKPSLETRKKMGESRKGKLCSDMTKNKLSAINSKKIRKLSLEGEFLEEFDSVKKAAISLGKTPQNISKCLSKSQDTAYGFKWEYVSSKFYIFDTITKTRFNSVIECADFYGEKRNNMSAYLNGGRVNNKYNFLIKIEDGKTIS